MEELIKELEHHYNKLCAEEIYEIFKLATEYFKKMDTVESCVLSNQFQNLKNKTKNETFAKLLARKSRKENLATLEELTSITKFDQEHYLQYEREVREKDPERTKILFSLHNLLNMFKSGIQSIFIEFDELKNIFDYFHISAYKQIRAFVDIIQSNGMLGVGRDELFLPNYEALVTHGYHYITVEEVANILLDEKLEEFLMDENPANPLGQREVFDCFKETRENYTEQFRACLELDRLFSTKAYTLTEEDYQTIKEKMEFLSFGDVAERVIKQMQNYSKMSNNKVKAKDNNSKGEVSIPKK
ncbi:MAG: hypothetical protein K2G03_02990, partial [Bacilli bacterium]|nr:hypothetical protein [Bacilli bacterium]